MHISQYTRHRTCKNALLWWKCVSFCIRPVLFRSAARSAMGRMAILCRTAYIQTDRGDMFLFSNVCAGPQVIFTSSELEVSTSHTIGRTVLICMPVMMDCVYTPNKQISRIHVQNQYLSNDWALVVMWFSVVGTGYSREFLVIFFFFFKPSEVDWLRI